MNHFSTHLKNRAESVRLTNAEKEQMRAHLVQASAPTAPLESPYQPFLRPQVFAYSFLALLFVGGGTAYAAQGSLPNSPLYPIKIHVNEKVEAALAFTPTAKVEVNEKLAERRIEEVKTLAAQGTLDATMTADIEENFDFHSAQAKAFAKKSSPANAEDATTFEKKVTASLDALDTSDTMVEPEKENTRDGAVKRNSKHFIDHVRAKIQIMSDN